MCQILCRMGWAANEEIETRATSWDALSSRTEAGACGMTAAAATAHSLPDWLWYLGT